MGMFSLFFPRTANHPEFYYSAEYLRDNATMNYFAAVATRGKPAFQEAPNLARPQ
jgi:hypothetical protein